MTNQITEIRGLTKEIAEDWLNVINNGITNPACQTPEQIETSKRLGRRLRTIGSRLIDSTGPAATNTVCLGLVLTELDKLREKGG